MKYIIIGNSIAALKACDAIRVNDENGDILLCPQDAAFGGTYDHQRIDEIVDGTTENIFVATREEFANTGVTIYDVRVIQLDVDQRRVVFANGQALEFDRLLLAMDAIPQKPDIPGVELNGVQTFWSLNDAQTLRTQLTTLRQNKAVVLSNGIDIPEGDGTLGLAATRALRRAGVAVTFITSQAEVGVPLLDSVHSELLAQRLLNDGVDVLCGVEVKEMIGDSDGRLEQLVLEDGETREASVALITMGVRADLSLLQSEKFEIGRGVAVNAILETNQPGVFAAGYVSEQNGYVVRTQEQVAEQGTIAGMNMTGAAHPYSAQHSDLYTSMEDVAFPLYG